MKIYLVCFDISDDRIRLKMGQTLCAYGERVQESVFEVVLRSDADFDRLLAQLRALAGNEESNVRFYRLCERCRSESLGIDGARVAVFPAAIIV